MVGLDKQEALIVKELTNDPRISDNQIARLTGIPVKTVNRKRKLLEEKGLLQYFTYLDTSSEGTGDFSSRKLYMITFKEGITRSGFMSVFPLQKIRNNLSRKHILESHLGEYNGRLVLLIIIESRKESDILEIFNAEIMPVINESFGESSIRHINVVPLTHMLTLLHNYVPKKIMQKLGIGYDKEQIFVADEESYEK